MGHREHMGSQNTTKQSTILTYCPPPGRCTSHCRNIQRGGAGGNCGGGWGEDEPRERAEKPSPRGWRRREAREETGSRRHTAGPRPSYDDGPWEIWWREEPWRRDGRELHGADQRRRSVGGGGRRQRANEPGGCRGSVGPRRAAAEPQRWGPRWSHLLSDEQRITSEVEQPVRPGARAGDRVITREQAVEVWVRSGAQPLHRGWGWADDRSGNAGQGGGLQSSSAHSSKVPSYLLIESAFQCPSSKMPALLPPPVSSVSTPAHPQPPI